MSKLDKLVENKNFKNNQNYILSKNTKKNIIKYAFHWIIDNNKKKAYCIKKIYNNKNYIKKLEINQIWYIDKNCISGFYLDLLLFFWMWIFFILWLLRSWIPNANDKWIVISTPIILILAGLFTYFKARYIEWKYFIFKDWINSNKTFLERYE